MYSLRRTETHKKNKWEGSMRSYDQSDRSDRSDRSERSESDMEDKPDSYHEYFSKIFLCLADLKTQLPNVIAPIASAIGDIKLKTDGSDDKIGALLEYIKSIDSDIKNAYDMLKKQDPNKSVDVSQEDLFGIINKIRTKVDLLPLKLESYKSEYESLNTKLEYQQHLLIQMQKQLAEQSYKLNYVYQKLVTSPITIDDTIETLSVTPSEVPACTEPVTIEEPKEVAEFITTEDAVMEEVTTDQQVFKIKPKSGYKRRSNNH